MRIDEIFGSSDRYTDEIATAWTDSTEFELAVSNVALSREYFRSLRAAEMAAWEMTGGDYVRSAVRSAAA